MKPRFVRLLPALFLLVLTVPAWGRYASLLTGRVAVETARPLLTLALPVKDGLLSPGRVTEYPFTVSNRELGEVSEVGLTYSVSISIEGGLPLRPTLLREGAELPLSAAGEGGFSTLELSRLPSEEAVEAAFLLRLHWPPEENSAAYAGGSAWVTVTVTAGQEAPA